MKEKFARFPQNFRVYVFFYQINFYDFYHDFYAFVFWISTKSSNIYTNN